MIHFVPCSFYILHSSLPEKQAKSVTFMTYCLGPLSQSMREVFRIRMMAGVDPCPVPGDTSNSLVYWSKVSVYTPLGPCQVQNNHIITTHTQNKDYSPDYVTDAENPLPHINEINLRLPQIMDAENTNIKCFSIFITKCQYAG